MQVNQLFQWIRSMKTIPAASAFMAWPGGLNYPFGNNWHDVKGRLSAYFRWHIVMSYTIFAVFWYMFDCWYNSDCIANCAADGCDTDKGCFKCSEGFILSADKQYCLCKYTKYLMTIPFLM